MQLSSHVLCRYYSSTYRAQLVADVAHVRLLGLDEGVQRLHHLELDCAHGQHRQRQLESDVRDVGVHHLAAVPVGEGGSRRTVHAKEDNARDDGDHECARVQQTRLFSSLICNRSAYCTRGAVDSHKHRALEHGPQLVYEPAARVEQEYQGAGYDTEEAYLLQDIVPAVR